MLLKEVSVCYLESSLDPVNVCHASIDALQLGTLFYPTANYFAESPQSSPNREIILNPCAEFVSHCFDCSCKGTYPPLPLHPPTPALVKWNLKFKSFWGRGGKVETKKEPGAFHWFTPFYSIIITWILCLPLKFRNMRMHAGKIIAKCS